jgi:O-antigen/teichoic acid export membrane protein
VDDVPSPEELPGRALTGSEVRRRAAAGVAAVGLRQVAIRAMGLIGTIVLAHLLRPNDFGAVAVGLSVVTVFSYVGDAGTGAGLIRGQQTPSREDLAAFLAFQLVNTVVLALLVTAVGLAFGLIGRVTALMIWALPLISLRLPVVVLLERELRYQPLVVVEFLEMLAYNVWAIVTVLAGWGVWGLASATPVRALLGSALMLAISPAAMMVPRYSWRRMRGLIRFGVQYQATSAVQLVRDQGLNIGTAVIAGTSTLGLWSLAYRVLQVPFLLFHTAWRVSFPVMARLIGAGEDPRPILERGLALAAMITGALLAVLVATAPALVPSFFGPVWTPAENVIPWASLGVMFAGPISVATAGYLYAVGDSWSVLLSAILQALVWIAVAFALLPVRGVEAIGIGWLAASAVEATVLVLATRRRTPIHVFRHFAVPASVAAVASAAGWAVSSYLGPTVLSTVSGAAVAAALYGAGVLSLRRRLALDALVLGRRAVLSLGR